MAVAEIDLAIRGMGRSYRRPAARCETSSGNQYPKALLCYRLLSARGPFVERSTVGAKQDVIPRPQLTKIRRSVELGREQGNGPRIWSLDTLVRFRKSCELCTKTDDSPIFHTRASEFYLNRA